MAAVQDFAGGAVEAPVHAARQAREQQAARSSAGPETPHAPAEGPPVSGPTTGGAAHDPAPSTPPLAEIPASRPPVPTDPELIGRVPESLTEPARPTEPATETPRRSTAELQSASSIAGTASAVGDRFRGDAVTPTGHSEDNVRRELVQALPHLVGETGMFKQGSHPPTEVADGDRIALTVRGRSGEQIEIHVGVTRAMRPVGAEGVPVAHFRYDAEAKVFIVEVSAGAEPRMVERAVAHELTEITALNAGRRDTNDALSPGGTGRTLSAHDEGRLAELQVLSRQLDRAEAAGDVRAVTRLRDDAEQLAAHLGLVEDTAAARSRSELARRSLPEGSPARTLLDQAITGAKSNPFVLRREGHFETDLPILAGQLERARAMGDAALEAAVVAEGRLLLLGSRVVKRERTGARPPTRRGARLLEGAGQRCAAARYEGTGDPHRDRPRPPRCGRGERSQNARPVPR